jgi:hypothetical protein
MSKEQRDTFIAGWRRCLDLLVDCSGSNHTSAEAEALRLYPDPAPRDASAKRLEFTDPDAPAKPATNTQCTCGCKHLDGTDFAGHHPDCANPPAKPAAQGRPVTLVDRMVSAFADNRDEIEQVLQKNPGLQDLWKSLLDELPPVVEDRAGSATQGRRE